MNPEEYITFRADPSNDHISDGMWCGQRLPSINMDVLLDWKVKNPDKLLIILEKRRGLYADALIQIDQGLLAKAKAGDARAIELVWARFENWSPKIEEQAAKQGLGKNKTLADLMNEL